MIERKSLMADELPRRIKAAALDYLDTHELSPLALCGPKHSCGSPGKVPHLEGWTQYCAELPDRSELASDFDRMKGNVGIATGIASGVIVVDIDSLGAHKVFQRKLGQTRTPIVRSGRGEGWHYYFSFLPDIPSLDIDIEGYKYEVKSSGKQVVVPPSLHAKTFQLYRWETPFDRDCLENPPDWLVHKILRGKEEEERKTAKAAAKKWDASHPIEIYNQSEDYRRVLVAAGWKYVGKRGDNESWGKSSEGKQLHATFDLNRRVFYNFSTLAEPLEADRGYSPQMLKEIFEEGGLRELTREEIEAGEEGKREKEVQRLEKLAKEWRRDFTKASLKTKLGQESKVEMTDEELDLIVERAVPSLQLQSVAELMQSKPEKPAFVIPEILPKGLTVLAGAPKVGKSRLALGLSLAIASGGKALGAYDVEPKKVLYCALEDGKDRLQMRIGQMLYGQPMVNPQNLFYFTNDELPMLDSDGLNRMQDLVQEAKIEVVIIDTWNTVRAGEEVRRGENPYQAEYRETKRLQSIAMANNIALILIHHTTKAKDLLSKTDAISGTRGITAGADTLIVLERYREEGRGEEEEEMLEKRLELYVEGRDVRGATLALDSAGISITCLGDLREVEKDWNRSRVLNLLAQVLGIPQEFREEMTTDSICDELNIPYDTVRSLLHQLQEEGLVLTNGREWKVTEAGMIVT